MMDTTAEVQASQRRAGTVLHQVTDGSPAAIMARGAFRHGAIKVSLIAPCDIVKMC